MKKDLILIKIGGNIINNEQQLKAFLQEFAQIEGNKILVHGGGKLATEMCDQLGIKSQMIDGRRITDAESLKIVTMVYGGLINKNIVANLQKNGCNALGLTGTDGNLILAHKRKVGNIDYGYAGDIDQVNGEFLKKLISLQLTPIIAPITGDKNGQLLNTNADTIASEVALEMAKIYNIRLIYVFEKNGLLKDINNDASVIHEISIEKDYNQLVNDGTITEGMLVKTHNIAQAIQQGVQEIALVHASQLLNYLAGEKRGTTFKI